MAFGCWNMRGEQGALGFLAFSRIGDQFICMLNRNRPVSRGASGEFKQSFSHYSTDCAMEYLPQSPISCVTSGQHDRKKFVSVEERRGTRLVVEVVVDPLGEV